MSEAPGMLDRLRGQQEKYRRMVDLVTAQRSLFAAMDVDGILGLIERKRCLLAEIDGIEAELAPLKSDWVRVRAEFSADEGRAMDTLLDETRHVLEDLMRLEDEGRSLLKRRSEEDTQVVDGLLQRNRARGAYGAR
ncbi:MAG TPA: hypothetical protein VE981_03155 [Planctomycetota bacterium]|nr:hypothetical protein [Planctomycetota bacterium]